MCAIFATKVYYPCTPVADLGGGGLAQCALRIPPFLRASAPSPKPPTHKLQSLNSQTFSQIAQIEAGASHLLCQKHAVVDICGGGLAQHVLRILLLFNHASAPDP